MKYIITTDGGTTNTRLYLFKDDTLYDTIRCNVGASDGKDVLIIAMQEAIRTLCERNGISVNALEAIVASGMIGSEKGLCDVPRIPLPAAVRDLCAHTVNVPFDDIAPCGITFIPGLLRQGSNVMADGDYIRGEETEALGLIQSLCPKEPIALLLPGTHNKLMLITPDGTVTDFYTAMSGDIIRAAAEHTILASSLSGGFNTEPDAESVVFGYTLTEKLGLTGALFKLRVGDLSAHKSPKELYDILLGTVLHEDISLVKAVYHGKTLYVSGSDPFRTALGTLFERFTDYRGMIVDGKTAADAAAFGAYFIAKSL